MAETAIILDHDEGKIHAPPNIIYRVIYFEMYRLVIHMTFITGGLQIEDYLNNAVFWNVTP
jgi:hypothetical protein